MPQSNQAREAAAAEELGAFVKDYLKQNPELNGVHYSDLFERYLSVQDKPDRVLFDWLPSYFVRTGEGMWRVAER